MSAEQVLNRYNTKLCGTMPMEESKFLQILEKYEILPEDSKHNIQAQKTKMDKADYYIQHVIKASTDLYLPKLIKAIEHYYRGSRDSALPDFLVYMIAEIHCNEKPLMRDIDNHVVEKWATKWKQLGSQLKIGESVIRIIDYNYPTDCERCCREMLRRWQEETAHPTWKVLFSALDQIPYEITTAGKTSSNPKKLRLEPIDTSPGITPLLEKYANNLKKGYKLKPEISTQLFISNEKKQFVNITLLKSLKRNKHDTDDDRHNPEHVIENEVVYDSCKYWNYDDIFDVDCTEYQLLLIEGDAGTGKTTLANKVCKMWAKGDVLKKYSCIILAYLKNIKFQGPISLETLLAAAGQPVSKDICDEVSRIQGKQFLIWLEGWDELDNNLVNSAFDNLLQGMMLTSATVVITTRPSATRTLQDYCFTHKYKITGFEKPQIEKYVNRYCDNTKAFMIHLDCIPGLVHLAVVPLYLAILVMLYKQKGMLPRKLTNMCMDFLLVCLQQHKKRKYKDLSPVDSFNDLPPDMLTIFYSMQVCAYDRLLHHSGEPFTEVDIKRYFKFTKVPEDFDGLGFFSINNTGIMTCTKHYDFIYKPIQELLAALHLSQLNKDDAIREITETFGSEKFEMVWVFYAGLTELKQVPIEKVLRHNVTSPHQSSVNLPIQTHDELVQVWNQCKTFYKQVESKRFLLTLISCCYEAYNSEACRIIANHFYGDKVKICRLDIPPNEAKPYLLLAVSYFITHSGKAWSLRCNIPDSIPLLFKYISNPYQNLSYHSGSINNLWVLCCMVTSTEVDAYCRAIKSQPLLQWIDLLPGSYLGDEGTSKLCECFYFNSELLRIEISECGIGSQGLQSIACLLNANRNILYVDLRKNMFKLDDVKNFLQQIKHQQHLEMLLLDKEYCKNSEVCAAKEEIKANNNKFSIISETKY